MELKKPLLVPTVLEPTVGPTVGADVPFVGYKGVLLLALKLSTGVEVAAAVAVGPTYVPLPLKVGNGTLLLLLMGVPVVGTGAMEEEEFVNRAELMVVALLGAAVELGRMNDDVVLVYAPVEVAVEL